MHSFQTRKYGISESKIQALIMTLLPTMYIIVLACLRGQYRNYCSRPEGAGPSLVPRPSRGEREGLVRTVCACALISRHSGNSVLRTDNSVFKSHYRILSALSLGSLREREHNQYTSVEKRSHSLSSVFTICLWNTVKSTLYRECSDESLLDLTEGFCRFYSD